MPSYSEEITLAFQVEDRIAELGLRHEYYHALGNVVAASVKERFFDSFDLIHASAEHRCRAALVAVGVKRNV